MTWTSNERQELLKEFTDFYIKKYVELNQRSAMKVKLEYAVEKFIEKRREVAKGSYSNNDYRG